MSNSRETAVSRFLSDRFSSEWKLLAETEIFVSHTPEYAELESQFREWRERLRAIGGSDRDFVTIRSAIVSLRKELRLKGYDLSLAGKRLVVDGYRDDSATAQGFARAVVCFTDRGTFFLVGQANHVEIAETLENQLSRVPGLTGREWHFLWYRRDSAGLVLSGSATETAQDFARLEARARANPMKLLSALRDLS